MDRKQQQESTTDGGEGSGSGRRSDGEGENDGRGMRESSSSALAGGEGPTEDDPEATEVRSLLVGQRQSSDDPNNPQKSINATSAVISSFFTSNTTYMTLQSLHHLSALCP